MNLLTKLNDLSVSFNVFLGEWGEWGACAVTCGIGQRSREGCTKKPKPGHKCPHGHVTTQTEMCSTTSCSPSAYSSQGNLIFEQPEIEVLHGSHVAWWEQ